MFNINQVNNINNLDDILSTYKRDLLRNYSEKEAEDVFNQCQTAVMRYTLPGWGFPKPQKKKLTKEEKLAAIVFTQKISVSVFLTEAKTAQQKTFMLLETTKNSQYCYTSHLQKLLDWCSLHPWAGNSQKLSLDSIPFKVQKGYGRVGDNPVVNRPHLADYTLQEEQLTPTLKAQIAEFRKYRTQKYYPLRQEKPVRKTTDKDNYGSLLRLLGWLVNHYGMDINSITLDDLIPSLPVDATGDEMSKVIYQVESWLCDFISFLEAERQVQNGGSIRNYLALLLALAKFQYLPWNDNDNYAGVRLIRMIRNRMNQISADLDNHEPVADMSKKWMELPDFMREVVEPLRLCCRRRKNCGDMRSLSAVAWSLEGYLLMGNLSYMPPRRQQELRDLRMAMSCPVKRPKDLPSGAWIHPLPADRLRGDNKFHGYLHRTADGRWLKDMTPESYKTGDVYGHQELEIPNVSLPNGYHFHDYLEMWLYGYVYDYNGCLRPVPVDGCYGGKIIEARSVFNPEHDFVFCQKVGTNFNATKLGSFFTNLCHSLTGIRVTPHLLRDMFATHFLDTGASDDLIRSLAYAMGHSVETLRKIYDRRRPAQKRRPIEQAVLDLVQKSYDAD